MKASMPMFLMSAGERRETKKVVVSDAKIVYNKQKDGGRI